MRDLGTTAYSVAEVNCPASLRATWLCVRSWPGNVLDRRAVAGAADGVDALRPHYKPGGTLSDIYVLSPILPMGAFRLR